VAEEEELDEDVRKLKDLRRNLWRRNMRTADRVEERKTLKGIGERHDFLKNPRFLPNKNPRGAKLLTKMQPEKKVFKHDTMCVEKKANKNIQYFKCTPETLKFTEWSVGNVYEGTVEFCNVSASSRTLKVLPPKTSYFSLGLGKYPGSEGIVAPGMSVRFNVKFMPDSLCDYDDELVMTSQADSDVTIKLKASRPPPVLTIGDVLSCGHCLIGGIKSTLFQLNNFGGKGKFCFMSKKSWPAANFKTAVNPAVLEVGKFQIKPAFFEINPGSTVTLEVVFTPQNEESYSEQIVMVCDNCHVKYFTLEGHGETASVSLVTDRTTQSGGENTIADAFISEARVGEVCDATATNVIRFQPVNPMSFYTKQLTVQNDTNVELPFSMHILKPNLVTNCVRNEKESNLDFYPDENSPFVIEPTIGLLKPKQKHDFFLTFAPKKIGEYDSVVHMLLNSIPCHPNSNVKVLSPPTNSVNNYDKNQTCDVEYSEVIGLEVEAKGECHRHNIVLEPPAILVQGSILQGQTVRRKLRVLNYSMAPVTFRWEVVATETGIVGVDPPVESVNPGELVELEVKVTGEIPGCLDTQVRCVIDEAEQDLVLPVKATVKGPTVLIDDKSLDFDLVQLGNSVKKSVSIRNVTQIHANWKISIQNSENSEEFELLPSQGTLEPLERHQAYVLFTPTTEGSHNCVLQLDVQNGATSHVKLKAFVQSAKVCFMESSIEVEEVYLNTPAQVVGAQLVNQTPFPTEFRFGEVLGEQKDNCDVIITPSSGKLSPKQLIDLKAELTCNIKGQIDNIFIPCYIENNENPIILSINCFVKGLDVKFCFQNYSLGRCIENKQSNTLEFIEEMKLGETANVEFVMENLTGIETDWSLKLDNFMAPAVIKEEIKPVERMSPKKKRISLRRTANLSDPNSMTKNQIFEKKCVEMLRKGDGISFELSETSGKLKAFEKKHVIMTVYADMWGSYVDNIVCDIEGHPVLDVPVNVVVEGCPLIFKLGAQHKNCPILRFGTHLKDADPVDRRVKMYNNSHESIRIDWRVFDEITEDDEKIIDFNLWCGEAFPQKLNVTKPAQHGTTSTFKGTPHKLPDMSDSSDDEPEVCDVTQESVVTSQAEDDLSLHVGLDVHSGARSDGPYKLMDDQIVIHGKTETLITVRMTPSSAHFDALKWIKKFNSYALGYLTLVDKSKCEDGKISRLDGNDVTPIRLEMMSSLRKGNIEIEGDGESFHLALSDVIKKSGEINVMNEIRTFILRNTTHGVLEFKLSTNYPFFIVENKKVVLESSVISLPSLLNKKVKVGFKADSKTFRCLKALRAMDHLDGAKIIADGNGSEWLQYEGSLRMDFVKGGAMEHPLNARISVPQLHVTRQQVDMGTCFVGQRITEEVELFNLSDSEVIWSCEEFAETFDKEHGSIEIEPIQGILPAYLNNVDNCGQIIKISYTAKSENPIEGRYMIRGKLGEYGKLLRITGNGSFDGAFEIK